MMLASGFHHSSNEGAHPASLQQPDQQRMRRKRKSEVQDADSDRFAKRLGLLNLDQHGIRSYVPVEVAHPPTKEPIVHTTAASDAPSTAPLEAAPARNSNDAMRLDDTPEKSYIHSLDDSDSEIDSDTEGKVTFNPGMRELLKQSQSSSLLPQHMLDSGQSAEQAGMQLVLYKVPSSLTVPEEQDGVRKAVIEARERLRQQRTERSTQGAVSSPDRPSSLWQHSVTATRDAEAGDDDAMDID